MASLDSLPPDQRAVLQLVLQRGRTYDDIAQLLSIDRAAVRDRALAALDQLGPETRVPAERRSLITDYLLGQLPEQVSEQVRERLAQSASERAWARVVASELAPPASRPLPEIPADVPGQPEAEPAPAAPDVQESAGAPEPIPLPRSYGSQEPPPADPRPSSRRGGAALLALGALIAVIVVIIIIASSGSSKHTSSTSTAASTPARTGTTSTAPQVVAQINLLSPTHTKTAGIAEVLRQGTADGIAVVAQNVPPNTKHDAYAVWLYNSPSDSKLLGFVNPGVGSNGRLSTAGALPSNAAHYKQLIVTIETQASPHAPGKIILEGALTGV
jgi:hypothetical protein